MKHEPLVILDALSSSQTYDALSPVGDAFAWLRAADLANLPDGKTLIDDKDVFVLVQGRLTKPLDAVKWEAHRRHADIQYVAEKDFVPLETGFPHDAHRPGILIPGADPVVKLVVKVVDRWKGVLVCTFGGKGLVPDEVAPNFYAAVELLEDGGILVANRQGNGPDNGQGPPACRIRRRWRLSRFLVL